MDIKLDQSNKEFYQAVEFVQSTNKSLYLTGKAGAGKTTFLKYIRENVYKQMVVLAPTGVAAINAGGMTLNSFFQLPFSPFIPGDSRLRTKITDENRDESIYNTFKYNEEKRQLIKQLELLIIDEVSMVRCDTLDVIDKILKVFRSKSYLPFGGVQVVLIGDAHQLPPVVKRDENEILTQFYDSPFFFSSYAFSELNPVHIELQKIYRQKDQKFIDILNAIRENRQSQEDLNLINSKYDAQFNGYEEGYITLTTKRDRSAQINQEHLDHLEAKLYNYKAELKGNFPSGNMPTDFELQLKEGAQVMFVKNDTGEFKEYYNGKIGVIKKLEDEKIIIEDSNSHEIEVERATWENISYSYNKETKRMEEVIEGSFKQYPIKLAWAITVHKSQGLTFDKVILDVGDSFLSGQVYVALSRCTSLEGIVLKSKITPLSIRRNDHIEVFSNLKSSQEVLLNELNDGRADKHYANARKAFQIGNFDLAYDEFRAGMRLRDELDNPDFKRYLIIGQARKERKSLNYELIEKGNVFQSIYQLAIKKTDQEKLEEAINLYSTILEMNPKESQAYFLRGKLYVIKDKYELAFFDFVDSLFYDPINLECLSMKDELINKLQMQSSSFDSDILEYESVTLQMHNGVKILEDDGLDLIMRAVCKSRYNDYNGAMREYDSALELYPENSDYWSGRGVLKYESGDVKGAYIDFDRAIEISPPDDNGKNYLIRGSLKFEEKDYFGAIEDLTKYIEWQDDLKFSWKEVNKRAFCYLETKSYQLAINDYQTLLNAGQREGQGQDLSKPYYDRGIAKSRMGELEEAIKDFTRYITEECKLYRYHEPCGDFTEPHWALYERGIAWKRLGVKNNDREALEEALSDFSSGNFENSSNPIYRKAYHEVLSILINWH